MQIRVDRVRMHFTMEVQEIQTGYVDDERIDVPDDDTRAMESRYPNLDQMLFICQMAFDTCFVDDIVFAQ